MKKTIGNFLTVFAVMMFLFSAMIFLNSHSVYASTEYEKIESKIDGIGFYSKGVASGVTTEVYVNPDSYSDWVTDWTGTQYVALHVNQPTASGWPVAINLYDSENHVTFLNTGDPSPAVDVYDSEFEKIGMANTGYGVVWSVANKEQWLLFDATDIGLSALNLSKVSQLRFAFDITNNPTIELEIGEMRIFKETPNADFSNGTTVLDPANMTDAEMSTAYILVTASGTFTDYMNVKRVFVPEPIVLDEAESYADGLRIQAIKKGGPYQIYFYGKTKDLSQAQYLVFNVSNTTEGEVPLLMLGGVVGVGTTTGFSGESVITLNNKNEQGLARVEYSNIWIPSKFSGKIIVPKTQIAGYDALNWQSIDIIIMNIDAITNPTYSVDISSISYVLDENVTDFASLGNEKYLSYIDINEFETDDKLVDKIQVVYGNLGTHVDFIRLNGSLQVPEPTFAVTQSVTGKGTVNGIPSEAVVKGSEITVTVTADDGWTVKSIKVNGVDASLIDGKVMIQINEQTEVVVVFEEISIGNDGGDSKPGEEDSIGGCGSSLNVGFSSFSLILVIATAIYLTRRNKNEKNY